MRIVALLLAASVPAFATDVLTHHNDLARTGAVLDEKMGDEVKITDGTKKVLKLKIKRVEEAEASK